MRTGLCDFIAEADILPIDEQTASYYAKVRRIENIRLSDAV
jgi:hypothetical protein